MDSVELQCVRSVTRSSIGEVSISTGANSDRRILRLMSCRNEKSFEQRLCFMVNGENRVARHDFHTGVDFIRLRNIH